jgi:hypothetical protein
MALSVTKLSELAYASREWRLLALAVKI